MTTPEWPVSDVPGTRKYCRIKALITSHENHHAPHVSWTTRILTQYKQNYNIPTQGWSKVSTSRLCLYSKHPGDRSFRQSDCSEKENHDKSSFTWSVLSISMNPSKIRSLAAISGYDCPALSKTSGVHRFRLLAYWRRIACNKIKKKKKIVESHILPFVKKSRTHNWPLMQSQFLSLKTYFNYSILMSAFSSALLFHFEIFRIFYFPVTTQPMQK